MSDRDNQIEAFAILYAMETDLPPKIVSDLCMLICTTDRKSLEGLQIFLNSPARNRLVDHIRTLESQPLSDWRNVEFRTNVHQNSLISRLKSAGFVR